ncbi:virulence factor MVIN family protein [Coriobacterium glomerans PW2]|uniref:Virulence factor MVIN family protein n=1 Tax=Coriobacterium glomerans (strain ATCC 49209 / DSM 20642 / JCM 10262 / PW2) TaxID=700015 RepID=F2N8I1_CORGP|nr:murein biosynthesis integral membrane protein MurJ [Coriobacterium glomerans]AEB07364.1 virulence factor MVIN family protein [Coriobacterium glomerans PW2]
MADKPRHDGNHFGSGDEPGSCRPDETSAFLNAAGWAKRPLIEPDKTSAFLEAAGAVPPPGCHRAPALPAGLCTPSGADRADARPSGGSEVDASLNAREDPAPGRGSAASAAEDDMSTSDYGGVMRSARLMTGLIVLSRVTGFIRTWAMAFGIGISTVSTAFQISNNLPNTLYELVMGGMLVTAFLPVYMDVRRNRGRAGAEDYIGNLLGILLVVLGVIVALSTVFAPAVIWTQSFLGSSDAADAAKTIDLSVFFFRYTAVQILFYGLGSVFSSVLNAHREYFWSSFAPVLNNVVTIASFLAYRPLSQVSPMAALLVIAVGSTAGVAVQMVCQIPALIRLGIRPRLRINLSDPALRQTVALGVPTLVATACTFVLGSVTNSTAMHVQPETGASVIAYSRLWYTLPYALIAIPLSTALYTELARDASRGDTRSVRAGISRGVSELFFFMIPLALYVVVYSFPLNLVYAAGAFTVSGVHLVASYTAVLALSLPFYGQFVLLQKSFSALMDMRPYARFCLVAAVCEATFTLVVVMVLGGGMELIALSNLLYFLVLDALSIRWLRRRLHGLNVGTIIRGFATGAVLGALGAAAGWGVMQALQATTGPLVVTVHGTEVAVSAYRTLCYVVISGCVSLLVTFGAAVLVGVPEADAVGSLIRRLLGGRSRRRARGGMQRCARPHRRRATSRTRARGRVAASPSAATTRRSHVGGEVAARGEDARVTSAHGRPGARFGRGRPAPPSLSAPSSARLDQAGPRGGTGSARLDQTGPCAGTGSNHRAVSGPNRAGDSGGRRLSPPGAGGSRGSC